MKGTTEVESSVQSDKSSLGGHIKKTKHKALQNLVTLNTAENIQFKATSDSDAFGIKEFSEKKQIKVQRSLNLVTLKNSADGK